MIIVTILDELKVIILTGDGDPPLELIAAAEMAFLDRMGYLISRGCGNNKFKDKAFITACQSGNLEAARELVEKRNVNPKGDTLLSFS